MGVNEGYFLFHVDKVNLFGWFHLVVVYLGPNNGQGLIVYVNGTAAGRDATRVADVNQQGNGQLVIGKKFIDSDNDYSSVAVDAMTLWSRELTVQEIEDLYQMFP